MNKVATFLKDMTYNSRYEFLDMGSNKDELMQIAAKRGIKFPARDLAPFKCIYAFIDRKNLNGCTLPREEVEKSIDTLVGKAIDFDHLRKNVVGHWIDVVVEGDTIVAYGVFYKGNFKEDYLTIKDLMENGVLAISFEAYGHREGSEHDYNLRDIEFAGGALLIKTKPAFPGSEVMELAQREKVLEMASVMVEPNEYIHFGGKDDSKGETFSCECINCGYSIETEQHCSEIKCEKCNGQMRRKDRPGPGQGKLINKDGGKDMTIEELKKELASKEEELSKVKKELTEKDEIIAKKDETLEKVNATIEELKKESEEAKVKIEEIEQSKSKEIEKARKDATVIAERKSELGKFAEELTDEDLLNDDKYEVAKMQM
ncbi:MAG: hypothetical protein ACOC56_07175, partial [Atribacterota bacterium]